MKYTRERKGTQQTKHRQNIQRGTPLDIHMRIFLEHMFDRTSVLPALHDCHYPTTFRH